jgi:hypothetical protein
MAVVPYTPGAVQPGSAQAIEAQRRREEEEERRRAQAAEDQRVAIYGRTAPPGTPRPQGGSQGTTTVTGAPGPSGQSTQSYIDELRRKRAAGEPLTEAEAAILDTTPGPTTAVPVGPGSAAGWSGMGKSADALTALRDKFLAERAGIGGPAPTLDRTGSDRLGGMQLDQIGQLQRVASGLTPSIADAQRRSAMLDATQSILGTAAASRPGELGGGQRAAFRALSDAGRRAGLDSALVKANEVSQAQGQIGQLLGSARGAENQLALGNLDSSLRSRGMDIDQSLGLGKLGLEAQTTESETRLREAQINDLREKIDFAYAQLAQERDEGRRKMWMDMITSTVGALAGVGAAAAGA